MPGTPFQLELREDYQDAVTARRRNCPATVGVCRVLVGIVGRLNDAVQAGEVLDAVYEKWRIKYSMTILINAQKHSLNLKRKSNPRPLLLTSVTMRMYTSFVVELMVGGMEVPQNRPNCGAAPLRPS